MFLFVTGQLSSSLVTPETGVAWKGSGDHVPITKVFVGLHQGGGSSQPRAETPVATLQSLLTRSPACLPCVVVCVLCYPTPHLTLTSLCVDFPGVAVAAKLYPQPALRLPT
ncbi:hypothetical protein J6590_052439, partial [Homalodisca vitripennis]